MSGFCQRRGDRPVVFSGSLRVASRTPSSVGCWGCAGFTVVREGTPLLSEVLTNPVITALWSMGQTQISPTPGLLGTAHNFCKGRRVYGSGLSREQKPPRYFKRKWSCYRKLGVSKVAAAAASWYQVFTSWLAGIKEPKHLCLMSALQGSCKWIYLAEPHLHSGLPWWPRW